MLDRLAASTRDALVRAGEEARTLGHPAIGADHLLLALSAAPGPAGDALRDADATRDALSHRIAPGRAHTSGQVPFAPDARRALEAAQELAGDAAVTAEHVLLALTETGAWALTRLDPGPVRRRIAALPRPEQPAAQGTETEAGAASQLPPEPWFRPPG